MNSENIFLALKNIKKTIDIIIDKQQEPNINLAISKLSKYRANTVSILNKKPNAANIMQYFITTILLSKFINWAFHSGGVCFSKTNSSWILRINELKVWNLFE